MDKIHVPHKSYCTDNIVLNVYFQEYLNELASLPNDSNIEDLMLNLTNNEIPSAKLKELEELTKPDLLKQKFNEYGRNNSPFVEINHKANDNPIEEKPGTELLVTIRVFFPILHSFSSKVQKNRSKNVKPCHEIALLGSHTLADLRDKIVCTNDVGFTVDVDFPFKTDLKPKDMYPSGFIFIDNVFYNDFRKPNAIDYSEIVRKWGQDRDICDFKVAEMDKTQIKDLYPRFGYYYVYQHQGKCEHLLMFMDARLTSKKDLHFDYPQYTAIYRSIPHYCEICKRKIADYLCSESSRFLLGQTYLCEQCFVSFNYINGEKVDNFKAYRFYDRTTVM